MRDTNTGALRSGQSVNGDGSFAVTLARSRATPSPSKPPTPHRASREPCLVGTVPFGSALLTIPITPSISEANYHPRTLATGREVAVSSAATRTAARRSSSSSTSPPIPPSPRCCVRSRSTTGRSNGISIQNGWAVIAANDLIGPRSQHAGFEPGRARRSGLVRIRHRPRPAAWRSPRSVTTTTAASAFTTWPTPPHALHPRAEHARQHHLHRADSYGPNYLIATTTDKPGGVGHDVVVIDKRDPNSLVKVGDLDIPAFDGFRGKVVGTTLYLGGVGGGLAVVDLQRSDASGIEDDRADAGDAFSVDWPVRPSPLPTAVRASRSSTPPTPSHRRSSARSRRAAMSGAPPSARGMLYAVNEQALVVIQNVTSSPILDSSLLTIATDGASSVSIAGAPRYAFTGGAPITVNTTNTTTNAVSSTTTVAGNGSFLSTVAGIPGNLLTLSATDKGSRTGIVALGQVPFGATTTYLSGQAGPTPASVCAASSPTAHWPRHQRTTNGSRFGLAPVADLQPLHRRGEELPRGQRRDPRTSPSPTARLLGSDDFASLNLADPNATPFIAPDQGNFEYSVAILGNYAYTATNNGNDGRIRLYDVATIRRTRRSSASRDLGWRISRSFLKIRKLAHELPRRHLAEQQPRNVVVITLSKPPASLVKLGDFNIPNFVALRGGWCRRRDALCRGWRCRHRRRRPVQSLGARGQVDHQHARHRPADGPAGTNEIVVADGCGGIT